MSDESPSPRVSIGLPVYNGERYIEESVRSVLGQTFADIELIISDNGSTDSTVGILEKLAADDDRITLVLQPHNRGAAWNYNAVFTAARGEYFRWHAHDDLLEPECIARLVAALDDDPTAVLAHSWTRFVDDAGVPLRVFQDDLGADSDEPHRRLSNVVRRLTYCNPVFGLIRRTTLQRTALIGSFPGSDVPLLYELSVLGRFAIVPAPLFVRRPGNSTKSNPSRVALAAWFGPESRGRRFPSAHHLAAAMSAIRRAPHPPADQARLVAVFAARWPVERARRQRRRMRRQRRDRAAIGG